MEAIVLGGGLNSGPLKAMGGTLYEAGIPINNRPMVEYIIKVLEEMEEVEKVLVAIPPGIITPERWTKVKIIPPGERMIDSLIHAIQHVQPTGYVLVVASDIPFITKEAIRDFLASCRRRPAEVYYPFVPKTVVHAKYPTTKRTFVRLKEATVTGGNVFLIQPRILLAYRDRIEQAIALRKRPIKLCRLLGFKFLVKLLTGQLQVAEIEARVEEILQVRGAGILSMYPEIGVDVDKPSDLLLARAILGQE
ncbi:MAG: NTP transferase domain-containing protein [Firmicutes bacterium]|nr:NTP transferase domain-containing protein [Bacillota bacterium]